MSIAIALMIGLVGGVSGGLFGIGGGIIIVPACAFLLGMSQKTAQGTSLMALLLPVGLLGVWNYWRNEQININLGLWIALGFVFGALAGSQLALNLNEAVLRRVFACFLVLVALQLFLKKDAAPSVPAPAGVTSPEGK